jgi:hypothetical protein
MSVISMSQSRLFSFGWIAFGLHWFLVESSQYGRQESVRDLKNHGRPKLGSL